MITKGLVERIYSAASIQRWNDHVRPMELFELDKQAHKMIFAYVIARYANIGDTPKIDWLQLIEGGIFEFLHRVILTDIKPAVYHAMMAEKGRELNAKVIKELNGDIRDIKGGFKERFERYLNDEEYAKPEKRVLKAAHYLATGWEFKIIYNLNSSIYGIERTKAVIEGQIEDHKDIRGVRQILLDKKLYGFVDLCGQLRFQQRWAQTPRIPKTSVLGHLLVVALLSYFASREIGACDRRIYNNFFGALFHDLPEMLTRDIISPIKESVEGLDEIIKEYEQKQLNDEILPLLPEEWHDEMRYFVQDEFENKIRNNGRTVILEGGIGGYNEDRFSPIDGKIIRVCDKLAAYIEACISVNYGIKPRNLVEAKEKLFERFKDANLEGYNFGDFFRSDYFSKEG
jgi:putative hydrolase of HD superfamily